MGAEIKDKLRQSLMKITPYQTVQTKKDKDDSLYTSINSKKKTGLNAFDKARNSVDPDYELKSALEGLRSSYSVSKLNLASSGNTSP